MEEKSDVDIQLLAIPGVRHESVTDFAIESVERRFDAMYIMDIEERDTLNKVVTGSNSVINVTNTANRHAARNFDTSFAAAYFPDVVINDPSTKTNVQCPPSVAVLGALGFNDAIVHPWFAPAGFNRGALTTTIEEQVKLNRLNLDSLYDVDINPITSFPSTPGVVIWGQKTMLAAQSALDRVNVRRLLIDIRRQVKNIANSLLIEPNRESTLSKFSNAVTPILLRIQQQQGLDRFRVQIDTTTTTQADVVNNTIRGKIFLQPTRSVEFISLDFVVTNAGTEI
jgi:phage tail sheath protein FI